MLTVSPVVVSSALTTERNSRLTRHIAIITNFLLNKIFFPPKIFSLINYLNTYYTKQE